LNTVQKLVKMLIIVKYWSNTGQILIYTSKVLVKHWSNKSHLVGGKKIHHALVNSGLVGIPACERDRTVKMVKIMVDMSPSWLTCQIKISQKLIKLVKIVRGFK
jgi:hypothetical protein